MALSVADEKQPSVTYASVQIPPPYQFSPPNSPISPLSPTATTKLVAFSSFNSDDEAAPQQHPETALPVGRYRDSVLLTIQQWRVYTRIGALIVAAISFVLIVVGLVVYEKTKEDDFGTVFDPYTGKEIQVRINVRPNVTFASIGGINTVFSAILLILCWRSSKINAINNFSSAVFSVIGFVGFASTMSACVYLKQQSDLHSTLWQWACDYRANSDPEYHLNEICTVTTVSWVFGLVHASFDIVTVILSALAFSLVKWRLYSRHGRLGRVF